MIALAILGANELAGIYGIAIAVMAQLSLTGLIVALDAFGPITDNAGGIAEMADLPRGRPQHHRPARRGRQHDQGGDQGVRDRLRRARRAGAVQRLRDRAARRGRSRTRCSTSASPIPAVLIGLLIGGMMVYLFSALAIEAVGRAGGQVVEEVRRQFREKPGDHGGHREARVRPAGRDRDRLGAAGDDPALADPDRGPADRRPDQLPRRSAAC